MSKKDGVQLKKLVTKLLRENDGVMHPPKGRVSVGWPMYDEKEILHALDSLLSIRISQGTKVYEFEKRCAQYIGTKYGIACNSGSSANLLALSALIATGRVNKGAEVIVPASTFATVVSPIIQVGLVPVYVDVDEHSWNIKPSEIEKAIGPKTRVIMPVHTFGNPADMPAIMKIAKKHKLIVFEDCCEAHGAAIGKKKVGSFGDIATLSFFVAHNITTGEGGMVFTNDKKLRDALESLREFGRLPSHIVSKQRFNYPDPVIKGYDARYIFTRIGYNLRMTDIMASLGIEQIKKLDRLNVRRQTIVKAYNRALAPYEKFLQLPTVRRGDYHSYYGYPFMVKETAPFTRQTLVDHLEKNDIETRPFFGGCLPDQPAFRNEPGRTVGKLPISRSTLKRSIFIGCHPALTTAHIEHVRKVFSDFFKHYSA